MQRSFWTRKESQPSPVTDSSSLLQFCTRSLRAVVSSLELLRRALRAQLAALKTSRHRFEVASGQMRVLMISSNGSGLGHLTRLWSVEQFLDAEVFTYTLSRAYGRLGKSPDQIMYFPSYSDTGLHPRLWSYLLQLHLHAVVRQFQPDVILFDGTFVYRGLRAVVEASPAKFIWMQRGCWKKDIDRKTRQRYNASEFADALIVPGDYGCQENLDFGPIRTFRTNPIVFAPEEGRRPRQEARRLLNLDVDKKYCLIQLGGGVINDITGLRDHAIAVVENLPGGWIPVVVQNPLSKTAPPKGVQSISAYPLSSFYAAFDMAILAAGYNTVQECVEYQLPSVLVPNLSTTTDDQLRRARALGERGGAKFGCDEATVAEAIGELAVDEERSKMLKTLKEMRVANGSVAAADAVRIVYEGL